MLVSLTVKWWAIPLLGVQILRSVASKYEHVSLLWFVF